MDEPLDLDALELNYGPGADIRLDKWARADMRALIAELRATREWWKTEQALRRDLDERLREACCCGELSTRAERAEAALASENTMHLRTMQELREAEAAIARVKAWHDTYCGDRHDRRCCGFRAALRGDQ